MSRDRVELGDDCIVVDLFVAVNARLAMQSFVHEVLASAECFRFYSAAIVSDELVLGPCVIPDGLLYFSNEHGTSVKAKVGCHNF